jgi:hypothetical protein
MRGDRKGLILAFTYTPKKRRIITENNYQAKLVKKLYSRFPDCMILKNDSSVIQGIVDLLILYKDKWASLEVKRSADAEVRPNQDYFINKMNKMSFASYIYPENEEEVLNALQKAFDSTG